MMENGVEKYMTFIHLESWSIWNSTPWKTTCVRLLLLCSAESRALARFALQEGDEHDSR